MIKSLSDVKAADYHRSTDKELCEASKKNRLEHSESCFAGSGSMMLKDYGKSVSVASKMAKVHYW